MPIEGVGTSTATQQLTEHQSADIESPEAEASGLLAERSDAVRVEMGDCEFRHQTIFNSSRKGMLTTQDTEAMQGYQQEDFKDSSLMGSTWTLGNREITIEGSEPRYVKQKDGDFTQPPSKFELVVKSADGTEERVSVKAATVFHRAGETGSFLKLAINPYTTLEYQLDGSTVKACSAQILGRVVDDVSHIAPDTNLYDAYGSVDVVMQSDDRFPAALLLSFDEWNSVSSAIKQMARVMVGALTNASKDPGFDLRTGLHLVGATAVTAGLFIGLDTAAGAIQEQLGLPVTSFTGAEYESEGQRDAVNAALSIAITVAFVSNSLKDAFALGAKGATPQELNKIAKLMLAIEIAGAQAAPGSIVAGTLQNQGLGSPKQVWINSLAPQVLINGLLSTGIQSSMLSLGSTPLHAFAAYQAIRLCVFRPVNIGVQVGTAELEGQEVTSKQVAAIAIAQAANELALLTISTATYGAGQAKNPDGVEEQLMDYAKQEKLAVNPFNRARLLVSGGVDSVSRGIGSVRYIRDIGPGVASAKDATGAFLNRAYFRISQSCFGAALLGVSDQDFLTARQAAVARDEFAESIAGRPHEQELLEQFDALLPESQVLIRDQVRQLQHSAGEATPEEATAEAEGVTAEGVMAEAEGTERVTLEVPADETAL